MRRWVRMVFRAPVAGRKAPLLLHQLTESADLLNSPDENPNPKLSEHLNYFFFWLAVVLANIYQQQFTYHLSKYNQFNPVKSIQVEQ